MVEHEVIAPRAGEAPYVVRLDDRDALDNSLVGAKAANLARAARAGLAAVPGEVLTTAVPIVLPRSDDPSGVEFDTGVLDVLGGLWQRVSDGGRHPLAVRSSSTVEDLGSSSMAGRFTSVVGVTDLAGFEHAVRTVLASSVRAALADGVEPRPMGVLVQRVIHPRLGGVLFGVDPVSGDARHLVAEVSVEGAEAIVGGATAGAMAVFGPHGRLRDADPDAARLLDHRLRRRLARLARRAREHFDLPQDIEWAVDDEGRLWLLQTRPVTTTGESSALTGPRLGAGPLAETFPLPLRPLESDLWLTPVAEAMAEVLRILGVTSNRRLARSPVVRIVDGWAVCDLDLIGLAGHRSGWRSLTPIPAARHLRAAWRIGSLRAQIARTARSLGARTHAELAGVRPLAAQTDDELVTLLTRTGPMLRALHAHQMLAALLLTQVMGPTLGASATAALRSARAAGWPDDEIANRAPLALGLVPPRIGGIEFPATPPTASNEVAAASAIADLDPRDALRMWCRLVQELGARVVDELDRRLAERGHAPAGTLVWLTFAELADVVAGGGHVPPTTLDRAAARAAEPRAIPVPHAFRLDVDGHVVAERSTGRGLLGGRGAGGGRIVGFAVHDPEGPLADDAVLVVATLDPRLAPVIGRIRGLVAETGSVLSHLAILAREQHVATVVGVADARTRFPPGTELAIDGSTGEVRPTGRTRGAHP